MLPGELVFFFEGIVCIETLRTQQDQQLALRSLNAL